MMRRGLLAAVVMIAMLAFASPAWAETFTVNSTGDGSDANPGDGTCDVDASTAGSQCTLRAAIQTANATANVGGPDVIGFDIPTTDAGYDADTGVFTISPNGGLTFITQATVVDGTLQEKDSGEPAIRIDGANASSSSGLYLQGHDGSTVKGLMITRFSFGVDVRGDAHIVADNLIGTDGSAALGNTGVGINVIGASDNTVEDNVISGNGPIGGIYISSGDDNAIRGNLIGANADGGEAIPNEGPGIRLLDGSSSNTIGGATTEARNVISGNAGPGVHITGANAANNTIAGNHIGTNAAGDADLGNAGSGVLVDSGAGSTTIGGATAGARNVISGNDVDGIRFHNGSGGNAVRGNYVGVKADGEAALANGERGIQIDGSPNNTVGGTAAGARNVIHGGPSAGVFILGGAGGNKVQGNYVGTDKDGETGFGGQAGVWITGTPDTTIGGTTAAARNVISGHSFIGVLVEGAASTNVAVSSNYIGTNASGSSAVANAYGVFVRGGANGVAVGGSGAGNVIAGNVPGNGNNNGIGLYILDSANTDVEGNFIGTNASGTAALGNAFGLVLQNSSNAAIGGAEAGERNVISGNNLEGVFVFAGSDGNEIKGNHIGTNANGAASLGNGGRAGVYLTNSSNTTIGGAAAGERNVISGNRSVGVLAEQDGGGNGILGNYIGTNANGTADLGNAQSGIWLLNSPNNTVGGVAAGDRNILSGNGTSGVFVSGAASRGNKIQGNRIGTNAAGTSAIPNDFYGAALFTDSEENLIGGVGAGNVISGNRNGGVAIQTSKSGKVEGNLIGTDASGARPLGNSGPGVFLAASPAGAAIGGPFDAANTIAFNSGAGVRVNSSVNHAIRSNSIHSNGALGIDLFGGSQNQSGVTANDDKDPDSGPNALQNFPTMNSAVRDEGADNVETTGTLNSLPNTTFELDFFANEKADPSGHGEGERYIDTRSVTTNADGNAAFTFTLPGAVPLGEFITATATDPNGNTSEFSNARAVNQTGTIRLSSATYSSNEGDGAATIEVVREGGSAGEATVAYSTANGTATEGEDYMSASGTLTFADGDTSETFTIPVTADSLDEPDETVDVALSNASGANLGEPKAATLTITDDDASPGLSIDDVSLTEGNSGETDFDFTVRLSQASGKEVAVNYETANDTARAGSDYAPNSGTLAFAPGETEKEISIAVVGDALDEENETFFVNLSGASNATISKARGEGTIVNDDGAPSLSVDDISVDEGAPGATTNAVFTVTLAPTSGRSVSVDYTTADGTAKAGEDYETRRGSLTFAPGETEKRVTVRVKGDALDEDDETFFLDLLDPSNAEIGRERGTATIADDDTAPTVASFSTKRGAKAVPRKANVSIVFSEAMDASTLNAANIKLIRKGTGQVAATITSPAPDRVVLDPRRKFAPGAKYTVKISRGVKDADGTSLVNPVAWSFKAR